MSDNNSLIIKNGSCYIDGKLTQTDIGLLGNTIKKIGKKYYRARGKKLDKIINDIDNNVLRKATLGGCVIEKVNQTVIISKE